MTVSQFDRRTVLTAAAMSAAFLAAPRAVAQSEPMPVPSADPGISGSGQGPAARGGLSKVRLARMREIMNRHVESGRMPGIVALVSRGGETYVETVGTLAFGRNVPMQGDTIFRIASLTKPITAAAAMILVEETKLRLDDPVDAFLPELAERKVLRTIASELDNTVPANRPITLRDLLTFRFGHGAVMVYPERYPIQKAMNDAGVAPSANLPSIPPDELMKRYGSLPLLYQPGERWLYNSGSDILGVLIARASGKSFGEFLRERIFDPLGMKDTGFSVPAEKIDRLATAYQPDFMGGTDKTLVFDEARGGRFAKPAVFESGAGGLVSTADDYLAFCQMMLNKGVHKGGRILSRPSVELMTADHLTPEQKAQSDAVAILGENRGWGFGVSVVTQRDGLADTPGRFGWDGGYGTSAYTDPKEGLIGVLMTQRVWDSPVPPPVQRDFWTIVYQAIDD
jgi:CubicO group peptidase (beta-lactamase class C family)